MATPSKSSLDFTYFDSEWRSVFPLPQPADFFDLLQDRLSSSAENILFFGDTRFTLFINAIDRKRFQQYSRTKSPTFIYAGINKQRELLEKESNDRWVIDNILKKKLNPEWKTLSESLISSENSEISSFFYEKTLDPKSEYKLHDACKIYSLNDYFDKPTQVYTIEQAAEKAILETYFNIQQDIFISVPLIGFGEFDGIVHIIFKKELLELHQITTDDNGVQYFPEPQIGTLLRAFLMEYEGLFLDWDLTGENLEKITAISVFIKRVIFHRDEYFGMLISDRGRPEILRELKLRAYYRQHAEYFIKRLELNENIPGKIYQQYITNAVTAVLIDSYAHNVSAHALSTLAWWFYRRADIMRDEEIDWDALFERLSQDEFIDKPILRDFCRTIEERAKQRIETNENKKDKSSLERQIQQSKKDAAAIRPEDGKEIIRYPGPLAREVMHLLRFLTEKGAYWSGVTRDLNVGGKVSSLYSVLWYDFINNPFYLGTIAKTEDIMNVKVRVILYEAEPQEPRPDKTKFHEKKYRPENSGILAEVDLAHPRKNLIDADAYGAHDEILSVFVKKGERFEYFREEMKKIKIFFPGGVVGRHAFYTMIENEIRNVKHYNTEELRELRKNGLTVAIGVQQCSLHNTINHEIYRISVWLDTPTRLVNRNEEHLIYRKWKTLDGEIFDKKTYAPLLGGTYQDKVCAGFLLNGKFSYVQSGDRNPDRDGSKDTGMHTRYYPWVRPGCSRLEEREPLNTHIDYKISYTNPTEWQKRKKLDPQYLEEEEEDLEVPIADESLPKIGYLKKIFYLWRGQYMLEWAPAFAENISADQASWDNPSRFSIVHLPEVLPVQSVSLEGASNPLQTLRRKNGVVRVVKGAITGETEEERYAEAYKLWLYTLLGERPLYAQVIMREGKQPEYVLVLKKDGDKLQFVKESIVEKDTFHPAIMEVLTTSEPTLKNDWEILIAHRENDPSFQHEICVRYRNHGIYKSLFLPENAPLYSENDTTMMELFEVLATKVCIFDNRVHHRLRLDKDQIQGYHAFLRDKLKLAVFKETTPSPETGGIWLSALAEEDIHFLKNCHFLVMHLSFIESILPTEIPGIKAEDRSNVGLFIEKYILPLVGRRDNFFFVVTTGRGRNEWWTSLDKEPYKEFSTFTIFRAIESLLSGIENSVSMKDDIELKYRTVKNLYGA